MINKNSHKKVNQTKSDGNINKGHKKANSLKLGPKVKNPFKKIMELEQEFDEESKIRPNEDSLVTSNDQ